MATRTESTARADRQLPAVAALLVLAAIGWWWSVHSAASMGAPMKMNAPMEMDGMAVSPMSLIAFLVAWVAMMAAMMFPAVVPAMRLFAHAAGRGQAARVPFFVTGYFVVWSAIGLPVYFAWRALAGPLADAERWVAYLAGGVLIAAGVYQLTPLKRACLRHCRSPLSFFLRQGANLKRPLGALRAGGHHGTLCLGCCWALMAVLVVLGTMRLGWMLAFSTIIFIEKALPIGERVASVVALALVAGGVALCIQPHLLARIT